MMQQTFLDNFGHLADAPNGVEKLRKLILSLAVTGRLVRQDPKDEPASEVLKRICRNYRPHSNNGIAKPYFGAVPTGWVQTRLGNIIEIQYGKGLPKNAREDDGAIPVYGSNGVVGYHDEALVHEKAIVLGRKGSIGAVNIATVPFWPIDTTYYITPPADLDFMYVYYLLNVLDLRRLDKATAIPGLNREDAYIQPIPLPPTREQHRIVAKVDELMALCDRLEDQKAHRDEKRTIVSQAVLADLTTATEPKIIEKAWKRVSDHFGLIYNTPETVKDLRQAVLQLAVTGKLVSPNPQDKSASELLASIRREREQSAKHGRTAGILDSSSSRTFPPIVPATWMFEYLGNLTQKMGSGSTPLGGKNVYVKTGIKFIRSQNVWNDGLRLSDVAMIPKSVHEDMSGTHVRPGDILLNITGASIGRCAVVPGDFDTGNVNQHVAIIRLRAGILNRFVQICLISPFFQDEIYRVQVGVSREGLSMNKLKLFWIPVPPVAEQQSIVAKVDELMAMCDALELQLQQSQSAADNLLDSIVSHLTTGVVA